MTFTLVDVILLLIVFSFVLLGFVFGLIKTVGSLVGLVAGTWLAGHYFQPVAEWLTPIIGGNEPMARVVAFLIIFTIINRLVVFIFHLLDRAFGLLSFIPFAKSINRFSGLLLGLVEGVLTLGVMLYVVSKFLPESSFIQNAINDSQIAHYLVFIAKWLIWLLPEALSKVDSIF